MKTILFINNNVDGVGERLLRAIDSQASEVALEIYCRIDCLSDRLKQLGHGLTTAVLLVTSKEELMRIYALKDLLDGIGKILILPDGEQDTISLAHKLYPRFLSYTDRDFNDVVAVLQRMAMNANSEKNRMADKLRPFAPLKPIGNYLELKAA